MAATNVALAPDAMAAGEPVARKQSKVGASLSKVGSAGRKLASKGLSVGAAFRDFIFESDMVALLVAVVVGTAFTTLMKAFVADLITPFIAAIFGGTDFNALTFQINKSTFRYGHFLNELITFIIVALVMFFCVVLPMQRAFVYFFGNKFVKKGCPECCEQIPKDARKCKFCGTIQADIPAVTGEKAV